MHVGKEMNAFQEGVGAYGPFTPSHRPEARIAASSPMPCATPMRAAAARLDTRDRGECAGDPQHQFVFAPIFALRSPSNSCPSVQLSSAPRSARLLGLSHGGDYKVFSEEANHSGPMIDGDGRAGGYGKWKESVDGRRLGS